MTVGTSNRAFLFEAGDARLVGIVTTRRDATDRPPGSIGLLIVVGGPQYRVGSHRQFVLLAGKVADGGVPVMRFDFAGMGDSGGPVASFTERSADIRAAIDAFMAAVPRMTGVALWGLCDGASAALMYAAGDRRVERLVLVNPWVRSDEGLARTHLKHHYLQMALRGDFWRRLFRGDIDVIRSARELTATWMRARARSGAAAGESFQVRMARGWRDFRGEILLVSSGDDMTAREFDEHASSAPAWSGLLDQPRVTRRSLADADHTFSSFEWREQVAAWTLDFVAGAPARPGESIESSKRSNELA